MNTDNLFTESFDQFANRVTTTDLALYAGAGLIIWLLFREKLTPMLDNVKNFVTSKFSKARESGANFAPVSKLITFKKSSKEEAVFFELITSWKKTRDLAVQANCLEAVKVADQMFPYLSPKTCENAVSEQETEE